MPKPTLKDGYQYHHCPSSVIPAVLGIHDVHVVKSSVRWITVASRLRVRPRIKPQSRGDGFADRQVNDPSTTTIQCRDMLTKARLGCMAPRIIARYCLFLFILFSTCILVNTWFRKSPLPIVLLYQKPREGISRPSSETCLSLACLAVMIQKRHGRHCQVFIRPGSRKILFIVGQHSRVFSISPPSGDLSWQWSHKTSSPFLVNQDLDRQRRSRSRGLRDIIRSYSTS
jgi:hypothetical protein